MSFFHSAIWAAVLMFPLFFCAQPILAQEVQRHHPCFEKPSDARDAIHRLPENARYWLAEDVVYIITPEERCAFLHLNTDEERAQFVEQFWYRRTVDPISLDYDFKTEHYRRIVFANEKYSGQLAGWKTDRGRIYVLFGPPDSVDLVANNAAASTASIQGVDTHLAEKWRYHYIKGIGENVELHFEFVGRPYTDYALAAADEHLLEQADLSPDLFRMSPDKMRLYVGAEPAPAIRFKDLEALVVSRVVREQVKISQRIEFAAATHATSLAGIDIQIPCEACNRDGRVVPSVAYPLFIRVSKPSGWVVDTSELSADMATHSRSDSAYTLNAHLDVPLAPGSYQLAIAAKNPITDEAGILRIQLEVPTYESLGPKH
jgi:GWxTD domain-containing protein